MVKFLTIFHNSTGVPVRHFRIPHNHRFGRQPTSVPQHSVRFCSPDHHGYSLDTRPLEIQQRDNILLLRYLNMWFDLPSWFNRLDVVSFQKSRDTSHTKENRPGVYRS